MKFARLTNQILLGAVAFSVSFCVSLVVNRDIKQALSTGLISVPATYIGTALIHARRINQGKWLINSLQDEIQELEEYKTDLNQFLFEAMAEEQEVEASIKALQSELNYLRTQVSEGYNQRKEQNKELFLLRTKKQQQEAHLSSLQIQISTLENQLQELTEELNQLEFTKQTETRKIESNLNFLKLEISQLQFQVTEKENDKKAVEQEVINFKRQNHQLIEEKRTLQANLYSLQVELGQLQAKIIEKQNEQEALGQGLLHFEEQRRQLIEGLHNLKVQIPEPPPLLPPPQITELPDE
jgi:chromosome segregation ATPase